MCGVAGFITGSKLDEEKTKIRSNIFTGLLVSMQERGVDSTGIASIDKDCRIYKKAIKAQEFIKRQSYNNLIDTRILLGHTRHSTKGAVNNRNAHPFRNGRIVGCHNGSVENYLEIDNKVDVDSQVIFNLLNKYDNNYKEAFARMTGVFAVTWVDMKHPDKVYVVRTMERPFALAVVPEFDTIFWCSLELALESCLLSALGDYNKYKVYGLHVNEVYEMSIQNGRATFLSEEIKFKKKVFIPSTTNFGGGYVNGKIWTGDGWVDKRAGKEIDEMIVDSVEEWGCAWCEQEINFEKDPGFYWDERGGEIEIVCNDCREALDFKGLQYMGKHTYLQAYGELASMQQIARVK